MEETVVCPRCYEYVPNIAATRQYDAGWGHVIEVGFYCQHCEHEWYTDNEPDSEEEQEMPDDYYAW